MSAVKDSIARMTECLANALDAGSDAIGECASLPVTDRTRYIAGEMDAARAELKAAAETLRSDSLDIESVDAAMDSAIRKLEHLVETACEPE